MRRSLGRGASQWLVGKHDGNLCRMRPHTSSIANVLAHYGCNDKKFADFIGELLQPDPERRPSAEDALRHAWLQGGSGQCARYRLSPADSGEAGKRLRGKYPSLENVDSPVKDKGLLGISGPGGHDEETMPVCPAAARTAG